MNDNLTNFLKIRIDPDQRKKLNSLQQQTGLTTAAIVRQLLDNAQVVSMPRINARLPRTGNGNSHQPNGDN